MLIKNGSFICAREMSSHILSTFMVCFSLPVSRSNWHCNWYHNFHSFKSLWDWAVIGNRLFYFLTRYGNNKDRSKVSLPQFFSCMYVCMFVYVYSTGHTVCRMELKFLPRYLSIFIKRQRLSFWRILNFGGVMPLFRHFRMTLGKTHFLSSLKQQQHQNSNEASL